MTKVNGFRLDHAFGNQAFVAAFNPTCRYDHSSRKGRFSDHSALVISTSHGVAATTVGGALRERAEAP